MSVPPTPEQLAKGDILPPTTSQKEKREHHRKLCWYEHLARCKLISPPEFRAAQKFEKHYNGALGHDVRETDEHTAELRDLDGIPPTTYHSQKVKEIEMATTWRQWLALVHCVSGMDDMAEIGSRIYGRKQVDQARVAGTTLVLEALAVLVKLWGFETR